MNATGIAAEVAAVLAEADVARKLALAERLCEAALRAPFDPRFERGAPTRPARPSNWTVTGSRETPRRADLRDPRGRRALIHSVAHIELSAVELGLMAVADFPDRPREYAVDMLRVAQEECAHARLLIARLRELGGELGEEPVHLGLWETAALHHGLIERLAVVPRVLEAKGLDVSAPLRSALRAAGDEESARCLDRVYQDEIGHVAAGTRWFRIECARAGVDADAKFVELARPFLPRRRVRAFDTAGRRAAGFSERELAALEDVSDEPANSRETAGR